MSELDPERKAPEPGVVPGEPRPARDRGIGDPPDRDPMPPGDRAPGEDRGEDRDEDDPLYLAEDRSDAKGPQPDAPRWHGGVRNPDHPEFHSIGRRMDPIPDEPILDAVRGLTLDDRASRLAGADIAGSGGRDPDTEGTRADAPGDPRRDRPDARPSST
jgi:hypothetical protein